MTPAESWALVASVCLGLPAFVVYCACAVSGRMSDLERRYWRTLHTRTCRTDLCRGRVWERVTRDYDADLGFVFDREETCPACKLDANNVIEIDFDSSSFRDDVRALDREHTISGAL